uniref:Putative secreted protein n=1 Tax=Anopheles triannulatus TaxID=58253 RepID=A0A2M4B6Y1_9DIPT
MTSSWLMIPTTAWSAMRTTSAVASPWRDTRNCTRTSSVTRTPSARPSTCSAQFHSKSSDSPTQNQHHTLSSTT